MTDSTLFIEKQHPEVKLCVIVPVKDEQENLIYTLNALRLQTDKNGNPLNTYLYEVLLLTNNCEDQSYQIALGYQQQHPSFNLHIADIKLPKETAHIGTVRRLLMDEAYNRFIENKKPKGIIASTDGDSEVDHTWVYHIIVAMRNGIDVVGGRIISKNTPNLSRMHHLQNVTYRYYVSRLEAIINPCDHDPWPRHFQCYGPSLAVTCEAYNKAGRMPKLPFLEDEEFRKSLYRIDAKVRMCPNVKVYTSSRLVGKVDFGFSVQLQQWAEMKAAGKEVLVENVAALLEKYEIKWLLKQCWVNPQLYHNKHKALKEIARRLCLDLSWLEEEFKVTPYFGALWEKIELKLATGKWCEKFPLEPIDSVITQLRKYFFGDKNTSQKLREIA